jgi:hypothetical protein
MKSRGFTRLTNLKTIRKTVGYPVLRDMEDDIKDVN